MNAKEWLRSDPESISESIEGETLHIADWAREHLVKAVNDSATLSDKQQAYLSDRIILLGKQGYPKSLIDLDPLVLIINSCHE